MSAERVWGTFLFVAACTGLYVSCEPVGDKLHDRLTAYPAACGGEMFAGKCKSEFKALPPILFSANKEQQFVIVKSEGAPPYRLNGCVVLDREEWTCVEAYRAQNGAIRDISGYFPATFLPRWRWYLLKYTGKQPGDPAGT